jgi:hypothetical protein
MKKYLIIALAAFGLAACAKDDLADGNKPIHSGEVEESYIAINLTAADITRAQGDAYQDGTEAEREVKSAYFFFFDDLGNPFPVNVSGNTVDKPGLANGVNYLQAVINPTVGAETPNISDIKNAVLLLKTYKGNYPSQVVAVINWTPTPKVEENKGYSIEELSGIMSNIRGVENSFVMSNAVYADREGGTVRIGVPITAADIFKDETAAINDPITIHVERIAAKISVSTEAGNTLFNLNKKFEGIGLPVGANQIDVYAQILGWELYNDFSQSYLLKHITPTWTTNYLGFNWNDPSFYRSYWASSIAYGQIGANNGFKMTYNDSEINANGFYNKYGYTVSNYNAVLQGNYTDKAYTYVGENTNYDPNDTQNLCTKIILKAQLVQKDGETTYKPVEIARWFATEYAGKENLLKAVANTIKYNYFKKIGEDYVYIAPEDLMTVKGDGTIAPLTHVYFQLDNTKSLDWYIKDNNGTPTSVTAEWVNTELAKLEPALLYENGQTFYFVDVKHLPVGVETDKKGEYGIVRNHIYNVKINSIGGYGSPIYIGDSYLKDPEYPIVPGDEGSFVSAQVKILSWRLVDQLVDIQK